MSVPSEPWCHLCDMPRWSCVHRERDDQPPPMPLILARAEQSPRFHTVEASYLATEEYRHGWEHDPDAEEPGLVECVEAHDRQESWLCRNCAKLVTAILADLPALIYDLGLHATRQVEFVERGTQDSGDESPLPYDEAAVKTLGTLALILGSVPKQEAMAVRARWLAGSRLFLLNPEAASWAHRLSLAYRQAHRIIERPEPPVFLGPCPNGHDVWAPATVKLVECPDCDYRATITDHQRAALNAGEDRWLTVGELVGAITRAGELVTRDQINSWIRREGLVREMHTRPVWRDGQLHARRVYVYRLGDVRRLAQRAELRRRAG